MASSKRNSGSSEQALTRQQAASASSAQKPNDKQTLKLADAAMDAALEDIRNK